MSRIKKCVKIIGCMFLCSAMRQTFAKATPSDAIILYFSGHGIPGGLVCYDGFLYYSSVLNIMKQSKARQKMIFVDACYAGKMRSTNKRNPWRHQGKQVSTTASSLSFWSEACEAGLI